MNIQMWLLTVGCSNGLWLPLLFFCIHSWVNNSAAWQTSFVLVKCTSEVLWGKPLSSRLELQEIKVFATNTCFVALTRLFCLFQQFFCRNVQQMLTLSVKRGNNENTRIYQHIPAGEHFCYCSLYHKRYSIFWFRLFKLCLCFLICGGFNIILPQRVKTNCSKVSMFYSIIVG
jgi:hypothetical protein